MKTYLGIDAGSTFTKYCAMNGDAEILELYKTPTRVVQDNSANCVIEGFQDKYGDIAVVSCGYGRNRVHALKPLSELIALAKGLGYSAPNLSTALDIGGQDTKVIQVQSGRLKQFYVNDKCAAGSGLFLLNSLRMLDSDLCDIELMADEAPAALSSVCAVFAQTEIVNLIAGGATKSSIINAVVLTILTQAHSLLMKADAGKEAALTGGFTNIEFVCELFYNKFGVRLTVPEHGDYLSAIGCALHGLEEKY